MDPERIDCASGEKATELIKCVCPSKDLSILPVPLSHNLMVSSEDPEKIDCPLGENARHLTEFVWDPERIDCPSGEMATDLT